jgi:hypothetical protein
LDKNIFKNSIENTSYRRCLHFLEGEKVNSILRRRGYAQFSQVSWVHEFSYSGISYRDFNTNAQIDGLIEHSKCYDLEQDAIENDK